LVDEKRAWLEVSMNKTMMTVALLAALGLVAYVAVIQPAAAPAAAAAAADADEDGGFLGWLFGDESPWA
jgi:uncharacterized membrane protein